MPLFTKGPLAPQNFYFFIFIFILFIFLFYFILFYFILFYLKAFLFRATKYGRREWKFMQFLLRLIFPCRLTTVRKLRRKFNLNLLYSTVLSHRGRENEWVREKCKLKDALQSYFSEAQDKKAAATAFLFPSGPLCNYRNNLVKWGLKRPKVSNWSLIICSITYLLSVKLTTSGCLSNISSRIALFLHDECMLSAPTVSSFQTIRSAAPLLSRDVQRASKVI